FAALTQVERLMHPHSPDSDLARINGAATGAPVNVHASTCGLLNFAYQLQALTDGVFDPCLPSQSGRLQDVEIGSGQVICHAPVALDFGGFGKGYAVACAIEELMAHGCRSGLVNAGGDLRVFGPRGEPIVLRTPAGELTDLVLSDSALAVSDANCRF